MNKDCMVRQTLDTVIPAPERQDAITGRRSWYSREGTAYPLGATWIHKEQAYNFALYSKHATAVTLLVYGKDDLIQPLVSFPLNHLTSKSGRIWHCRIPKSKMAGARYYAYRVDGPRSDGHYDLHAFDPEKILVDPYATAVYFPPTFDRRSAMRPGSNAGKAPLGVLHEDELTFDWGNETRPVHEHDLVIYEMHVKGFTNSPTSGVAPGRRGTYLGVVDKIPYLQELGVTAVELLPIHQFDPQEGNYWGYMTLNFFAPHDGYATNPRNAHNEFREMVKAFHAAGIEVILDVVFNHTAESDHLGPCYSYKGIDNSTYYMTSGNPARPYENYSGTGNTLHCANRYVSRMILDSLRHWVTNCHVDGFRFDLASVFARRSDGSVYDSDSPIVSAIRSDPALANVRLIAEPWDASGLHQLGASFPGKRWYQWNGRFRDDVRRFVKGDPNMVADIMRRLYGSDDLFPDDLMNAYHPYQSINYVTSHDGFTLYDQVSYNERHNLVNGERNQDGHRDNNSWNCGFEGDRGAPPEVLKLRRRQVKNFCVLLMLSNGTPMFCSGDEFLKTQRGNNNPYNQDNELTWLDWNQRTANQDIFRFFRLMIAFRKAHPTLARSRYWRDDIRWYGTGKHINMAYESKHLAFCLNGASQDDVDLYVMLNAHSEPRTFTVQTFDRGLWKLVVDTSRDSPEDIFEPGKEPAVVSPERSVAGHSITVLMRPR
jgi:glycogen operon protein